MSVLDILTIPNERLKHKSTEVKLFDKNLEKLVNDMFDTLYASGNGIGLAAPQVGIEKRIVVIDLKEEGNLTPIILINPKIISSSKENLTNEEGCLSIPGYYAKIERPSEVNVEWQDIKGNTIKKNPSLKIEVDNKIISIDISGANIKSVKKVATELDLKPSTQQWL